MYTYTSLFVVTHEISICISVSTLLKLPTAVFRPTLRPLRHQICIICNVTTMKADITVTPPRITISVCSFLHFDLDTFCSLHVCVCYNSLLILSHTFRVLGIPAQPANSLLKQSLSVRLETGVVLGVGEKATDGGRITSLGISSR